MGFSPAPERSPMLACDPPDCGADRLSHHFRHQIVGHFKVGGDALHVV